MGVVLWIVAALVAFLVARIIPLGRRPSWRLELVAAIAAGALAGVVATALDFGGWGALDWRAAVFCTLCALAVLGVTRLLLTKL